MKWTQSKLLASNKDKINSVNCTAKKLIMKTQKNNSLNNLPKLILENTQLKANAL